jgi:hypothetical protein
MQFCSQVQYSMSITHFLGTLIWLILNFFTNTSTFVHTYITSTILTYEILKLRTTFQNVTTVNQGSFCKATHPKTKRYVCKLNKRNTTYHMIIRYFLFPRFIMHTNGLSVRREILAVTPRNRIPNSRPLWNAMGFTAHSAHKSSPLYLTLAHM